MEFDKELLSFIDKAFDNSVKRKDGKQDDETFKVMLHRNRLSGSQISWLRHHMFAAGKKVIYL